MDTVGRARLDLSMSLHALETMRINHDVRFSPRNLPNALCPDMKASCTASSAALQSPSIL